MTIQVNPKTALVAVVSGLGLWFGYKLISYLVTLSALVG